MEDWKKKVRKQTSDIYLMKKYRKDFKSVADNFKSELYDVRRTYSDPEDRNEVVKIKINEWDANFIIYGYGLSLVHEEEDLIACYKVTPKNEELLHKIKKRDGAFLIKKDIVDDILGRAFEDYLEYDWGYNPE